MKYWLFFILLAPVIIISCTISSTPGKVLSPDNLPLQEYTIDISKDTVLVTKNGALLKIPKGSLTTGNGNTVTLEVKEAYSIRQMIQAGLVTQSNGEPLSSGGMIYINARAGQDVKITQAIKVALPADYLAEGMQLFKGQKDENGNINWKEPAALTENKQLSSIQQGQVLFQSKCASCHALGKDLTGPDLAHIEKRFGVLGEKNYQYYEHGFYPYKDYALTEDSVVKDIVPDYRIYEHYDPIYPYKCNLIKRYGTTAPFIFTDTGTTDYVDDIYRYIQNESDKRNLPLPVHAYIKDCADSCVKYKQTIAGLSHKKEKAKSAKEELIKNNGELVEERQEPAPPVAINLPVDTTPPPPVDFEERVSPAYYQAEYYQFSIESFGWYNIDILLKGVNGAEESELFVRITGEYREKIKVYLIIPSVKVYVEGGPAERNPEEFAFYLKNGRISLPQNAKAYIMAVTETEESIAFALKEFSTALKQELAIALSSSTKEAFNAAIGNIGFDGLAIKAADAKNATEIRKTDAELKNIDQELKNAEALKPKNCDCDCGQERPDTAQKPAAENVMDIINPINK